MFHLSKIHANLAILTSLFLALDCAIASKRELTDDENYSQQHVSFSYNTNPAHTTKRAVAIAESRSTGILQTEFLPQITVKDAKDLVAGFMCEVASPCHLAQVCKAWHKFILDRDFEEKVEENITSTQQLARSLRLQKLMVRWWGQIDKQILENGIIEYCPGSKGGHRVKLSTWNETNGDLVLPKAWDQIPICFTRRTETFVNPVGENKRKTLFLLLTLSELKSVAQQLSSESSFIEDVRKADLSENAFCILMRCGEDDIVSRKFIYMIMKFSASAVTSISEVLARAKKSFLEKTVSFGMRNAESQCIIFVIWNLFLHIQELSYIHQIPKATPPVSALKNVNA